ncbi:hypothetical protein JNUCC83_05360 [Vagococcus sp. JNUCC 83]
MIGCLHWSIDGECCACCGAKVPLTHSKKEALNYGGEDLKSGGNLDRKARSLTINGNSVVGTSIMINSNGIGMKQIYDIKGNKLTVNLDGEELILTEEKVKGYIEREKDIMKRIATGNYLDRF